MVLSCCTVPAGRIRLSTHNFCTMSRSAGTGREKMAVATGRSDAVKFLPDGYSCSGSGRAVGSRAAGFAGKPNGDEPQRSVPVFR